MQHNSRIWMNDRRLQEERAYWTHVLDTLPESSLLFHAMPEEEHATNNRIERRSTLPGELAQKLLHICRDSDRKLYVVLTAIWHVLKYKLTGERHTWIVSPLEHHEDSQGHMNTHILLRLDIAPDRTFLSLVEQVNQSYIDAIRHCNFPLYAYLEQRTNGAQHDYVNDSMTTVVLEPLQDGEALPYRPCLQLRFIRDRRGIGLTWLARERMTPQRLDAMQEHFIEAALWLTQHPERRIGEFKLKGCKSPHAPLPVRLFQAASDWRHQTLDDLFRRIATLHGSRTAIVCGEGEWTYGDLDRLSDQLAGQIRKRRLPLESPVAIMTDRSAFTVAAILAALKAGSAYLPLDPGLPRERLAHILRDSGAELLLTHGQDPELGMEGLASFSIRDGYSHSEYAAADSTHDGGNLAYIIYTSGSTGAPKGVMIEHRNVLHLVTALREQVLQEDWCGTRVALIAPFFFDASVQQLFPALLSGATLYIAGDEERIDGERLFAFYRDHAIRYSDGTPHHLKMLLQSTGDMQSLALKQWLLGGDVLHYDDVNAFYSRFRGEPPLITNVYGPTECCVDSTYYHTDRSGKARGPVPIGRPLGDSRLHIMHPHMEEVPDGFFGELVICGPGVGRGYVGQAELNKSRFVPDPSVPDSRMYRSGDLCIRREDCLMFAERMDNQVKIRGIRIELGEIEAVIRRHHAVKEAIVEAVTGADGITQLVAHYMSDSTDDIEEALKEWLQAFLPGYMIPSACCRLEEIPLLPNGKINRKELRRIAAIRRAIPHVEPRTGTEQAIFDIWTAKLGITCRSVHDHFFEVGGHSIHAMKLAAALQKRFGVHASVGTVFQHPTVEKLASYVEKANAADARLKRHDRQEHYPLAYQQRPLFVQQTLYPESFQSNMPRVLACSGHLDVGRLQHAFDKLVQRHEMFRTSFHHVNDEPVMRVAQQATGNVEVLGTGQVLDILARFVRPFDLTAAPLVRIGVARDEEGRQLLLMDAHHMISDGASQAVMMRELLDMYDGVELTGHPEFHYTDYALTLNAVDGKRLQDRTEYWKRMFPTAESRAIERSGELDKPVGQRAEVELELGRVDAVRGLARTLRTTESIVLLASYAFLLHRYRNLTDLCVGVAVSGRPEEMREVIGMFASVLPLKVRVDPGQSFAELVHSLAEQYARSLEHKDCDLHLHTPQPDIMFVYSPVSGLEQGMTIGHLAFEAVPVRERTAKYEMTLECLAEEGGLQVGLDFRPDRLAPEEANRLLTRYAAVLKQISENPYQRLARFDLSTQEERDSIELRRKRMTVQADLSIEM